MQQQAKRQLWIISHDGERSIRHDTFEEDPQVNRMAGGQHHEELVSLIPKNLPHVCLWPCVVAVMGEHSESKNWHGCQEGRLIT